MRARLGTRADEIHRRYRRYFEPEVGQAAWRGGTADSALVGLRLSRDVAGIYLDGKRAQVDALNRAGLSLEEYRWTRSRVYAALGVPLTEIDIAGIIADVKDGRHPATRAVQMAVDTTASPAVRRLVEPHRKSLEENVGLAFFGL